MHVELPSLQKRWAIAFAALIVYALLFFLLYPRFGESSAVLATLPVVVMALLGGTRAGLLAGILSFPLNTLLLNLVETQTNPWTVLIQSTGGLGSLALVFIGWMVGLLRDQREWIARDITERKQAEARSLDLLLFNEKILNTAPVGIITYKITGECLYANENAARIVGTTVEKLRAQNFRTLESWKKSGLYQLAEKAIARKEPVMADIHHTSTFGKEKWLTASAVTFQSRAETQLLLTFSDITERKRAFEDSQKRVKQLTLLHEVAVLSTQVLTVDQLIESTTEIIGKNLFPDNFGVLLLDEEQGVLRAHPSYRFVSKNDLFASDVPLGQGVTGQVALTGQPVRFGKVEGLKNYINVDPGTSSELCVPIRLKERVLGVINAESAQAEAFSPDDELLLGTLAGQLATAIEQIRAAQAERQWLEHLAHANELIYAIAHISTHIEKALTQEEIVQTLGRELRKMGLTCCMAAFDKNRNLFTINYTSLEADALNQMEDSIGFPLVKHTFTLEKLNSTVNDQDTYHPAAVTDPGNEIQVLFPRRRKKRVPEILQGIELTPGIELLRLPLIYEENLLGILWVWGKGITKADLPILSIFAKQIESSLERARLFQEVQSLALTDPLTGLQNRRSLFELGRIEFARSKRMNRAFSCMMLDVDHFKQINDNYGHPTGDQVLREVAQLCKSSVREVDIIGRYGGEELVIFLPETDLDTAVHVAGRLRSAIEKTPVLVSAREVTITVSIGVATKDENTSDLQTLVARADQAMYIAKYRGRNRVATSK